MFGAGGGRFRVLAIAAAAALISAAVQAQEREGGEYIHVSWTEKDGLPGSYIGSITQDRDGYLWLVANGALVRFDGVRFVEWGSIWSPPLPRPRPSVVTAARDGSLWIGNAGDGGAARVKDGRVTNYSPQDSNAPGGVVRSIVEDGEGAIWAASQSGVSRFRHDRWDRIGAAAGLPSDPAYSVYAIATAPSGRERAPASFAAPRARRRSNWFTLHCARAGLPRMAAAQCG